MCITNKMALRSLAVARECYRLAIEKYCLPEEYAQSVFMLGWNYDIGLEFSDDNIQETDIDKHSAKSNWLCQFAFNCNPVQAIFNHGKTVPQDNLEIQILNEADLNINQNGDKVSVKDRLDEIKTLCGEKSKKYINSLWIAERLDIL